MLALRLPSSAMMREPLRSVLIGSVILGDSGVANASRKKMETSGESHEKGTREGRSFDKTGPRAYLSLHRVTDSVLGYDRRAGK
jgi:hypothetical protein